MRLVTFCLLPLLLENCATVHVVGDLQEPRFEESNLSGFLITAPMVCGAQDLILVERRFNTAGNNNVTMTASEVTTNNSQMLCSQPTNERDFCISEKYKMGNQAALGGNQRISVLQAKLKEIRVMAVEEYKQRLNEIRNTRKCIEFLVADCRNETLKKNDPV